MAKSKKGFKGLKWSIAVAIGILTRNGVRVLLQQ